MVKQVRKYKSALTKVLNETEGSNFSFEILFVVGKAIDNDNSIEHREEVANTLKVYNGRIVFYKELIENAYKAYQDYIIANERIQPLVNMFNQLEED